MRNETFYSMDMFRGEMPVCINILHIKKHETSLDESSFLKLNRRQIAEFITVNKHDVPITRSCEQAICTFYLYLFPLFTCNT